MLHRRVTVFVGHFGSGKTEIALNGALDLAATGEPVTLVDLDVVKPYFRSRAARNLLEQAGVELVAPGRRARLRRPADPRAPDPQRCSATAVAGSCSTSGGTTSARGCSAPCPT